MADTKPRRPTDATLRNVRAATARAKRLATELTELKRRLLRLERIVKLRQGTGLRTEVNRRKKNV